MPYKDTNPSNKTLKKMEEQEYGKEIRKQVIEEFAKDILREADFLSTSDWRELDARISIIKKQMLKSDDFKPFDSNESQVLEKK